jgi:hypothetical protein
MSIAKEIITKICTGCNINKNIEDFYKASLSKDGYKSKCKLCEKNQQTEYHNTLNGVLRVLLGSSKVTAKKRLDKGRLDAGMYNITFEDLKELWKIQKGLCYYSKIPMNYDKHEW